MDEIDRIRLFFTLMGIKRKPLLEKLGIDYNRFAQVMGRKQALRAKELIQIAGEFPEYEYWILSGKDMPEVEQLNPMSKIAVERREDERLRKKQIERLEDLRNHGSLHPDEEWELEELKVN